MVLVEHVLENIKDVFGGEAVAIVEIIQAVKAV